MPNQSSKGSRTGALVPWSATMEEAAGEVVHVARESLPYLPSRRAPSLLQSPWWGVAGLPHLGCDHDQRRAPCSGSHGLRTHAMAAAAAAARATVHNRRLGSLASASRFRSRVGRWGRFRSHVERRTNGATRLSHQKVVFLLGEAALGGRGESGGRRWRARRGGARRARRSRRTGLSGRGESTADGAGGRGLRAR